MHSLTLVPELKRLNKKLVFSSYSFGSVHNLSNAPVFWSADDGLEEDARARAEAKAKRKKKKSSSANTNTNSNSDLDSDTKEKDQVGNENEKKKEEANSKPKPNILKQMTVKLVTAESLGDSHYQVSIFFSIYVYSCK